MKNNLRLIFTLMCMGLFLFSCKKAEQEVQITVDTESVDLIANNPPDVTINLKANTSWILTAPKWVTPSMTYGSGDAVITLKIASNYVNEITSTESRRGEVKISGGGTFTGKATSAIVSLFQAGHEDSTPSIGGIPSLEELMAFATAVNNGGSTKRWQNSSKEVVLLDNIDMSSVTSWTPIGVATAKGAATYSYDSVFSGVFNGQGYKITGISWVQDLTNVKNHVFGLFGAVKDAEIKNLILGEEGDKITLTGSTKEVVSIGSLVGHAKSSIITGVTCNVDVVLAGNNASKPGNNPANTLMLMAGVVGSVEAPMTIGSQSSGVVNNGEVKTGFISNTNNGSNGMHVAGIVGYTTALEGSMIKIEYCKNYGDVSAPTGRGGGLIATIGGATKSTATTLVSNCENHGTIQDDAVGQYAGSKTMYDKKRMGGLVGGTATNNSGITIEKCINYGNVFSQVGCRTGGFVGHNQATIVGCENKGIILGNITFDADGAPQHGPGWACGLNGKKDLIVSCKMGGRVGEWDKYKSNPESAPVASHENALGFRNSTNYDPQQNQ